MTTFAECPELSGNDRLEILEKFTSFVVPMQSVHCIYFNKVSARPLSVLTHEMWTLP